MPFYHPWAEEDLAERAFAATHERIAQLASSHPDRLVGLGTVALHHPGLAVRQIEACVGKLSGVQIGTMAGRRAMAP